MGSKTILVAEAEQYILDLLDFNLKQTGFDVVIAMNGAEAMAAVRYLRTRIITTLL